MNAFISLYTRAKIYLIKHLFLMCLLVSSLRTYWSIRTAIRNFATLAWQFCPPLTATTPGRRPSQMTRQVHPQSPARLSPLEKRAARSPQRPSSARSSTPRPNSSSSKSTADSPTCGPSAASSTSSSSACRHFSTYRATEGTRSAGFYVSLNYTTLSLSLYMRSFKEVHSKWNLNQSTRQLDQEDVYLTEL